MDFNITKIIKLLTEKIFIIILATAVFGMGAFGISKFLIKPQYRNTINFMANIKEGQGNTGDITYANQIVAKYVEYMSNDKFLIEIRNKLNTQQGNSYTLKSLKKSIAFKQNEKAGSFSLMITTQSSEDSYEISLAFFDNSIIILGRENLFSNSNITIMTDTPKPEDNIVPISPDILLNTVIGLLLGLFLSVTLIIIIDRFDNTIKDEYDLIENYDIPLIGIVYTHKVNKENGV